MGNNDDKVVDFPGQTMTLRDMKRQLDLIRDAPWQPFHPEPAPDPWTLFRMVARCEDELALVRESLERLERRQLLDDYERLTAAWRRR